MCNKNNSLLRAMILLLVVPLGIITTMVYGPKIPVYLHRNDVRTVKNATYDLIKKYTTNDSAHYIYKLNWSYTDKVKYADARYVLKSTGNGSHTFKRVGLVYSDTEPVPDNVTKYKLEDVQKEKEREEREDSRDDGPTFIPFFIPIK